jgi:hypothetical protein
LQEEDMSIHWRKMLLGATALAGLGLFVAASSAQVAPPESPAAEAETEVEVDNDEAKAEASAEIDRAASPAEQARSEAREAADDFREAARDTTRDARRTTGRVDEESRETARDLRSEARDASQDARAAGRDVRRETREEADDARDSARDTTRDVRRDQADNDGRSEGRADARADADFRVDSVRSADFGLWFDRGSDDGLVINDIGTGVVSRWGFREGDRIYSVNGIRVDDERAFVQTLFDNRWRNQRANVIIYRHGRPWTVYVHPSQLVTEYTTVANDPLDAYGLVLDDRYDDYVVIWRVTPRSPAYYAGLRAGDVITTFDGRRLTGRDDFVRFIGQDGLDSVRLEISRNRQARRVDLDLSSRAGVRGEARTSLRPNLDAEGRVEGRSDTRVDGRFDGNLDGRIEGDADAGTRIDLDGNSNIPNRVEGSTIPGRLRGSAAVGGETGARSTAPSLNRTGVGPGLRTDGSLQGQGEVRGGVQGNAGVPTDVQGGVRAGVQGGVRSGGLFRGNRD